MSELKPCPQCGSPAEITSTGTSECYGWDWQVYGVDCTDVNGKHCGMSLSLTADFFYVRLSNEQLTTMWNTLNTQ